VSEDLDSIIQALEASRKASSFAQLVSWMEKAGCTVKMTKEGCLFYHPAVTGRLVPVPKPHGKGRRAVVKEPYVKQCIKLLEAIGEER
jgi:hypothetical protein